MLCGSVTHGVCRETNWETPGKTGNASQEESYPRTLYREWCGVVVPELVHECVCDC